ncbi:MAG TPA: PRC-barrel domain-containing protein [Gaiellaceae bacterium]|nr:PRC-barrel domain-containing protein [Gaiellaceae bacterium]
MADPVSWKVAERGWSVVSSDGNEVGKVNEVLGDPEADIFDGLAVGAGAVLDRPLYVPSEQVGAIEEGTVHLTIDAEEYKRLTPYEPPPSSRHFRAP